MAKVITTELQHSGASGANITLDSSKNVTCENNLTVDGNISVTGTGLTDTKSFRNLIINGAMQIAQRGTSSTTSGTYVADRWKHSFSGHDEAPTIAMHDLTSSDTGPWGAGFKKCLQLTNGNQTSGAGAADFFNLMYYFEGQDVANSGWDYKDPNSKITLSFWMKSSVAQNFHGYVRTPDGTAYSYPFETGSLSADAWTKITKTIPGNANLQIDNDIGAGFQLVLYAFGGTDYTATPTLNTWAAYSGSTRTPDQTSTWWTTNDSDIELTGFQLEVGDTATDFEHRSYGDELARCQRYFQVFAKGESAFFAARGSGSNTALFSIPLTTPLRNTPTLYWASTYYYKYDGKDSTSTDPSVVDWYANYTQVGMSAGGLSGVDDDRTSTIFCFGGDGNTPPYDGYFDAEL